MADLTDRIQVNIPKISLQWKGGQDYGKQAYVILKNSLFVVVDAVF